MNRAPAQDPRGSGTKVSSAVLGAVQLGCLVTLVVAGRAVLAPATTPRFGEDVVGATSERGTPVPVAETIEIGEHVALPARAARSMPDRSPRALPAHEAIARDASSLKESDHYASWRERLARDPEAFGRDAERALLGPEHDSSKVALLRAARDGGHPRAAELLAIAVEQLPDVERPGAGSVPRFALTGLAELAARDHTARALLGRIAWADPSRIGPALRAQAAGELARYASGNELRDVLARLELETDAGVQASIVRSLAGNPEARDVAPEIARGDDRSRPEDPSAEDGSREQ